MKRIPCDRRTFLALAGKLGLLGLVAPLTAAGCGGGGDDAAQSDQSAPAAKVDDTGCNDVSGLTESQIEARRMFEYVETAADPAEACKLCAFWDEPEAGQLCGGCTLFAGPVHPDGSCNSFEEA